MFALVRIDKKVSYGKLHLDIHGLGANLRVRLVRNR
jgi:hypothetical protein